MKARVVVLVGAMLFLALATPAAAENSVVVESKSFSPGQTACSVGVHVTNDLYLLAIVMPLEVRSLSGGAYPTTLLSWGLQPGTRVYDSPLGPADSNGAWPAALITEQSFAEPTDTANCSGPVSHTWAVATPNWDGVSPDAVLFASVSMGDPRIGEEIYLTPGADMPGTTNASLLLSFDLKGL